MNGPGRPLPIIRERPVPPPPPPYAGPPLPGAAREPAPEAPLRPTSDRLRAPAEAYRAPAAAYRALEAVYRDLDAEIARLGPRCDARGICCDFDRTDHVLYASSLEVAYLMDHLPRERWARETGNRCPLLVDGKCGARAVRMVGCRTYYCQEGFAPIAADLYERHYARVKEIARAFDLDWAYAPALVQLRAAGE